VLELYKQVVRYEANVQLNELFIVLEDKENLFIPINGEKQALATPTENDILSRVRIKFGCFKFSDHT
jgi:hypothetical protein